MTEYIDQQENEKTNISNLQLHKHFCLCCGKEEMIDLTGERYWIEEEKEKLWHKLNGDNKTFEYPSGLEHINFKNAEVCEECYLKWLMSFKFIDKILIE